MGEDRADLVWMLCGMAAVLQASGFDGVAFDPFSFQQDGSAAPEVDIGRGEQRQFRVMMLIVVPPAKITHPALGCLQGLETVRIVGAVFHRLELALGIRVVVGCVRARMAARHAQIGHELIQRFALHRPAIVGMQGKRVALDVIPGADGLDQVGGMLPGLVLRDKPAQHVAAVQIEQHIGVVRDPLAWPAHLGDVPGPDPGCVT